MFNHQLEVPYVADGPPHKESDGYLTVEVIVNKLDETGSHYIFLCDSIYGLKKLYDSVRSVAVQDLMKEHVLELMPTLELSKIARESNVGGGFRREIAHRLRIAPVTNSDAFALVYNKKKEIVAYLGKNCAVNILERIAYGFYNYPQHHDILSINHKINGANLNVLHDYPSACVEYLAIWPGLGSASESLRYLHENYV